MGRCGQAPQGTGRKEGTGGLVGESRRGSRPVSQSPSHGPSLCSPERMKVDDRRWNWTKKEELLLSVCSACSSEPSVDSQSACTMHAAGSSQCLLGVSWNLQTLVSVLSDRPHPQPACATNTRRWTRWQGIPGLAQFYLWEKVGTGKWPYGLAKAGRGPDKPLVVLVTGWAKCYHSWS